MSYLYTNDGAEKYASEADALAALTRLSAMLIEQGYTPTPHPTDPNRLAITHGHRGFVEPYVHDEPPHD